MTAESDLQDLDARVDGNLSYTRSQETMRIWFFGSFPNSFDVRTTGSPRGVGKLVPLYSLFPEPTLFFQCYWMVGCWETLAQGKRSHT